MARSGISTILTAVVAGAAGAAAAGTAAGTGAAACVTDGGSATAGPITIEILPPATCDGSQSGIVRVVTYTSGAGDEHWMENLRKSRELLAEAGVEYVEIERA